MTNFTRDEMGFRLLKSLNTFNGLPVGTYVVRRDIHGFYLENEADMKLPSKIYGNVSDRADRIINTFNDRISSTGVILAGEKGGGKTLLTKFISVNLREAGISTIIVNSPFFGDEFNSFISGIEEPMLVLFDEYEKVYSDGDAQNSLLTLFDGVFNNRKLFIVTTNSYYGVSDFMQNRPGRFFYRFMYKGLDPQLVLEYCIDNLRNKDYIDSVVEFCKFHTSINFDGLFAIVQEMNRYDENIGDATQYLNIDNHISRIGVILNSFTFGTDIPKNESKNWKYAVIDDINNSNTFDMEAFNVNIDVYFMDELKSSEHCYLNDGSSYQILEFDGQNYVKIKNPDSYEYDEDAKVDHFEYTFGMAEYEGRKGSSFTFEDPAKNRIVFSKVENKESNFNSASFFS